MNIQQFKQNVRNLKAIQETRTKIGNGIYGTLKESLIKDSPLYPKIMEMRRNKSVDKKKTEGMIQKTIKEQGIDKKELDRLFKKAKKEDFYHKEISRILREGEKMLKRSLQQMPIYVNWLSQIRGMGVLTSAQLIAIVGDITRFDKPSSLTHYFGGHNDEEGRATRPRRGKEASWNPKAKALLFGVIGDNFIKQRAIFRKIYDKRTAKTKRMHPEWWHLNPDGTKAKGKNMHPKHGYRDGIRVMMKRFLLEFWIASYQAKGLQPPRKPYSARFHPNQPFQPIFPYP